MSIRRAITWGLGAYLVVMAQVAMAFHTPFLYRVDRFEADGNVLGPLDGVPGVVDDFNAAPLSPYWYQAFGTVSEGGGHLLLTNPGVHFPSPPDPSSPAGALLDLSIAASATPTWVYDGSGDFVGTAYWEGVIPDVGHHYHFSIYTFGGLGGVYAETFGLAILRRDQDTVEMEQHLTEIDQWSGTFQNTQLLYHEIDESQATGPFIFRIMVDDDTNLATTEYSLDGGSTWESPFPPGLIFQGRTQAQFLLSADPYAGAAGTTTTTTVSGSTTTTTLPDGPCVATGCRVSTLPLRAKLAIKDKSNPSADMLSFKWKKGQATSLADFGDPINDTTYWFCLGNGAGTKIFEAEIHPTGGFCSGPCWKATGSGFTYTHKSPVLNGVRKLILRSGEDGKASVQLKIQGENAGLPSLPLTLPVTARLSNSLGECWAEEFDLSGLKDNSTSQFSGKSN